MFKELARTALCDPKDLFDAKGNMLALNEMPEDIRRAIASCDVEVTTEVVDSGAKGSKVVKVRTTKVKFWDKLRAIDDCEARRLPERGINGRGESSSSGGLMTSAPPLRCDQAFACGI